MKTTRIEVTTTEFDMLGMGRSGSHVDGEGERWLSTDARISWPRVCACCGASADSSVPVRCMSPTSGGSSMAYSMSVPYCSACAAHVRTSGRACSVLGHPALWLASLLCGALLYNYLSSDEVPEDSQIPFVFSIVVVAVCAVVILVTSMGYLLARGRMTMNCSSLGEAATLVSVESKFRGSTRMAHVLTFDFASVKYARLFARSNPAQTQGAGASNVTAPTRRDRKASASSLEQLSSAQEPTDRASEAADALRHLNAAHRPGQAAPQGGRERLIACPNPLCGKKLKVSSGTAGRRGQCPHCGWVFDMPA